jgi:hypothetical protein
MQMEWWNGSYGNYSFPWSLIPLFVGMFYRQCILVIDGKYKSKDGNKRAKDCRQVIDDKIRVSIDEK